MTDSTAFQSSFLFPIARTVLSKFSVSKPFKQSVCFGKTGIAVRFSNFVVNYSNINDPCRNDCTRSSRPTRKHSQLRGGFLFFLQFEMNFYFLQFRQHYALQCF